MGDCRFCGQPAGFFHHQHAECAARHDEGTQALIRLVGGCLDPAINIAELPHAAEDIANQYYVSPNEERVLVMRGWSSAVDTCLANGLITDEQESRLLACRDAFAISNETLVSDPSYQRLVKAAVLRDLTSGKLPQRYKFDEQIPFNLQKSEKLVWLFHGTKYLEDKTMRTYVGGSRGASVRVMKGVYYHFGAYKGQSVEHTERVQLDIGLAAATTKNIYFAGTKKSIRVPFAKIVSFQPYNDGIGFVRDAANAKMQLLLTGDGWFTHNLFSNLAQSSL